MRVSRCAAASDHMAMMLKPSTSEYDCVQLYAMTDWRHGFHFFGRNDVEAWSSDGSRLLRCRSQQLPHDMDAADTLAIGYIPFSEGRQRCVERSRTSC